MFSDLLKALVNQHDRKLPFVVYRKPKEEYINAILQKNSKVHFVQDFTETGFVFAPFDSSHPTILLSIDSKLKVKYPPKNIPVTFDQIRDFRFNSSQKEFHINLVKKGISQIQRGKFKKVVLSRKVETGYEGTPLDLFQNLLDSYATAFCYLWYHPEIGTWLGATPEILLMCENRQFATMSLAGTKHYVENKRPEWGRKELEEQQLVTDYIAKMLKNSVKNLKIGELQSVQAGNLWHLKTKLTASIENEDLKKIVQALHPTPAVCGMPFEVTKKFILENENYQREFYTGFLGELNFKMEKDRTSNSRNQENKAYRSIKNTTTLFVNLRCMQLKDSLAQVYIGGGVTKDSDAETEWQETVAKSTTMLGVINGK